jgi:nucleoside-diphosphate-sugar epimerase
MNIFLTGCSGFLGSHILHKLCVQNIHTIYCIIRNHTDINLFKNFPNITRRCRFVISDMNTPNKYIHILQKCHMAIHTAFDLPKEEHRIIDIAVTNLKNILDNVNRKIFRRFILTSSITTVYKKNKTCGESCWNIDDNKPFNKSKVLLEIECFKYKPKGINVVCVNPGTLFGPDIINKKSKNTQIINKLLNSPYYPVGTNTRITFCDVRDAATFHILALNINKIKHGRYIVCNTTIDTKSLIKKCNMFAPNKVKVPLVYVNKKIITLGMEHVGDTNFNLLSCIEYESESDFDFDNSKSKKIINYTKVDNTIADMMSSM